MKISIIAGSILILILGFIVYNVIPFTRQADRIGYCSPCWGKENKIYFIKSVTFAREIINPMSLLSIGFFGGGNYLPQKTEVYLCSMNYDGSNKQEIVKLGDTDDDTYWLPMCLDYCEVNDLLLLGGGTHPASGETYEGIYTIKTDGSNKKKISDVGIDGSWSPDGKQIAYGLGDIIWIINADGSNKHPISKKVSVPTKFVDDEHGDLISVHGGRYKAVEWEEKFYDGSPLWSPKGDLIAFVCHGWIWVMKPDGRERRMVIKGGGIDSWFPDGKSFLSHGVKIDLDGNVIAEFGKYGYLSSDGKRMVGMGFKSIDVATGDEIDLFGEIKHPKYFVYKRPNNIW
ncbi:MAG: hypothetical protein ABIF11_01505 [Nitrospirota bacterium]